ncbi:MAG: copper chaperone PCu(A)C [Rhizobiaceae bacterium]
MRLMLQLAGALTLTAVALVTAGAGSSHGEGSVTQAGDITVADPWVRAMLPGQPAGGGFMILSSAGEADRLVAATSDRALKVEIHSMAIVDGVMIMRPVEGGLEVPAGGSVALEPGGLHIMLMGVGKPFAEGETVPVTLTFEKAGDVDVGFPVHKAAGQH